jgi:hypothetical protein
MNKWIHILLFVLPAFVVWCQKPYVELIAEPNVVEVGQPINFTVKANMQGEINIDFPGCFQQGYNVMNGIEKEYDANTGELVTYMYYSKSGTIYKAGTYTVGPAYVRKGNKVYRSNTVTIEVKDYIAPKDQELDARSLRKPACGAIEVSKEQVYEGEALVINAKVISKFSPTHYESYQSYELKPTSEKHIIPGPRQVTVRVENIGRQSRYVFQHDKQVIFPARPGKLVIEPFEMTLQSGFDSYPILSRRAFVDVKPLPKGAPKGFHGAVGKFEVKCDYETKTIKQGDIASVTYRISGNGNLHDIGVPQLHLSSDLKLYGDPELKEKFRFTEKGAEGDIKITYYLQVLTAGKLKLPQLNFTYFDPQLEKYQTAQQESLSIDVDKDPQFVVPSDDKGQDIILEKYHVHANAKTNESSSISTTLKWVGISSPFCLALLFLIYKRRKKEDEPVVVNATEKEVIDPNSIPVFDANHAVNILKDLADTGEEKPFFSSLRKQINDSLSILVHGEIGWNISKEDLENHFAKHGLSEELKNRVVGLANVCEQNEYGGLAAEKPLLYYVDEVKDIFRRIQV